MTFFLSLSFYGAAFAAGAAQRLVLSFGPRADWLRRGILAGASLTLVGWLLGAKAEQLVFLTAWSAGVYGVALASERTRGRPPTDPLRRAAVLANRLSIAACVFVLATLKYELAQALVLGRSLADVAWNPTGRGAPLTGLIGVSYLTLKLIQVLIDAPKGRLGRLDPLSFAAFVFFFPTFIAGPIDRYQRFAKDLQAPVPLDWQAAGAALLRVAVGLFEKLVLAALCAEFSFVNMQANELIGRGPWSALGTLYAYGLYIYFDFSGYTHMAIGVGRLCGIAVPENFARPFLARNIQEFWNRWHISLSSWLRDYLYYPLSLALMRVLGVKSGTGIPALALFLTFVVMGVWHGDALACLLYGVWHGAALAGFKLFAQALKRRRPALATRLAASRSWRGLAVLSTLHVYFLGLLIFAGDFEKLAVVAKAFWARSGA